MFVSYHLKNPLIIVQLLLPSLKATSLNPPTHPTTLETASAAAMVAGKMPPKKQTRKPREAEKWFATFHQNKTKSYQMSNISLAYFYNTPHNHPESFLVIRSPWPASIIHLTTTQNHVWWFSVLSMAFFCSVFSFQADCHFQASRLRIAQKIFSGIMLMPSCRFWANFIMVQGDHKQQSTPPLCWDDFWTKNAKHMCVFLLFFWNDHSHSTSHF